MKLFKGTSAVRGQAAQKYNRLLAEGLAYQPDCTVVMISEMPVDERNHPGRLIGRHREKKNKVSYVYLPLINTHRVKDIVSVLTSFLECMRYVRKEGKSVIIADILCAPVALGGYVAARISRIPYVAVVTDLPEFVYGKKDRAYDTVSRIVMESASRYVFLTEQMNDRINDEGRPCAVVEGMADARSAQGTEDRVSRETAPRILLYTGNLNRKYGVGKLVEAYIKAEIPDTQLHIAGAGDMAEDIRKLAGEHENVVYCGLVDPDEAERMQKEAYLLINPRPSEAEYTRYSFPSKTIEYMASGTPVLMTDLPGVPEEYKEYVYLIKDESTEGIAKALKDVLAGPASELEEKGEKARRFVMENKNNRLQAEKVSVMLE
ncbi:MAG: glycosyltransferase [Lachnospiraceae bacterium]|nr:glycosyltransferase [Lachnospiraceae bacterium]